ncbi:TPR-like protein [Fomitiporia mediterranea MF3/22]|uniref:TPR-like protein n=1 Tax=Fomitiporia mediterranea (strain MF3/22) TaxID=694068 RepID=UPI000440865B|nr:TPR-like protein [Fomitiporia mediterranea MF3/22]EJD03441.1 TPR-like protein [Fomitiporia mediterranea MF3/22]
MQERGELDNAIFHVCIALGLCPGGWLDFRKVLLHFLGEFLGERFKQYGRMEDLEEAIEHHCVALQHCLDSHPDRSMFLNSLANSLRTQFEQNGQTENLDEAIELHRAALQLRPDDHPNRSGSLNNLAGSLHSRFNQHRQTADLVEAIELHRAALQLLPDSHPDRSASLDNLASSLQTQFEQNGQTENLDEAIRLHHAALQLRPDGHPDRSSSLYNLATSLQTQFKQNGQTADLDEAIELHRAALQLLPEGHPNRTASLDNLASSLQTRFRQHGQTEDLDEAIEHHRAGLQLLPDGHPNRFKSLNNLANSLHTRFDQYGQTENLDEAIKLHRAALQLCPDGHPDRSMSLDNLASSLRTRFEQNGQTENLNEAIDHHRVALQLCLDGHPDHSTSLNNLAISLQTRFQQNGQTENLDEAIELHRAALQLCPAGHPDRSASLNNLAGSLQTRFRQYGQTADLDEAIRLHRAALQLYPDSHPIRSGSLNNLAGSLQTRFQQHGRTADLDEAIKLHRAALQLCPDGHPKRSVSLNNLAGSLQTRFQQHGQTADINEAIELNQCIKSLECAAEHMFSSLVERLKSASRWVTLARNHSHHTTSRAYKVVMLLLQRFLVIHPTLCAQHDFLIGKLNYTMLTLDAVAYAVEENRLEEAIEILEQGRGLLWSQMRGFRTPLDDLADTNRELAERFRIVSRQLEDLATTSSALRNNSSTAGSGLSALDVHGERILSEERLKLKKKLSSEQEELIREIQQIPGFESFLTATPFKVLQQVASEGPVIVVNVSRYRSDALIILSREDQPVVCVPLDGEFCKDSVTLLGDLLEARLKSKVFSAEYDEVLRRAMKVLWDRVVSKVVKKLKELGITEGSRIWWCPTSFLSSLPFHAAGPFKDADGTVKYLLDDYVSSYTPTLVALINARLRENQGDPAMLIVGDTVSLKSTDVEIRTVRNNTRSYVSRPTILLNKKALRSTVMDSLQLQKVTWIHFACHGHLGSGSLDSSFVLSDEGLTLLDIIRANLPNAEFAFLSACHTAEQGDFRSFDEALHLAAAIQFCGFRSVIGTMWEMYDPDGPVLAREVYSYMGDYEDGEVIHKRSVAALRQAVLALRGRDGVTTERWVNLVHIGA